MSDTIPDAEGRIEMYPRIPTEGRGQKALSLERMPHARKQRLERGVQR